MEVGQTEILLAQKLSCGEPKIRKKAFFRLEQRINAQSAKKAFLGSIKDDYLKIWKGLYYCFWLQDKPLMQEELVDNIARLVDSIKEKNQKLLFLESFYEEIGKEWYSVDQWRMDKFLMFYRRMFRRILTWLKERKFDETDVNDVFEVLRKFVLNPDMENYPVGLKLHFVGIFLDELDNAGAGQLSGQQISNFLTPFHELLRKKSTSDVYFNAILNDIFELILEYCAGNLGENSDEGSSTPVLNFDLAAIKSNLFDVGKSKFVTSKRRAALYDLVKKFDLLIKGVDPFFEEISDCEGLLDSDIDQAACDLVKSEPKKKSKLKRHSKKRLRSCGGDSGGDLDENENSAKKVKKSIRKSGKDSKNKFKRVKTRAK